MASRPTIFFPPANLEQASSIQSNPTSTQLSIVVFNIPTDSFDRSKMPSSTVEKKRKRRDAEAAAEKVAGKKSKKVANPAPNEEEEDEKVQEVVNEIDNGNEDERPEASDDEDDEAGDELPKAEGLAAASAPILAPPTDSESFDELRLSERSMKAINDMGFTKMTAIQRSVRSQYQCWSPS